MASIGVGRGEREHCVWLGDHLEEQVYLPDEENTIVHIYSFTPSADNSRENYSFTYHLTGVAIRSTNVQWNEHDLSGKLKWVVN